jgi:DNA polymerase IV
VSRKIIHIDMDAFYASVEQMDNPELIGKPVVVGGRPDSRGVVAACSYEARAFGIKSAMPCSHAYVRCPEAVFIAPRLGRYREISTQIMDIFRHYTDLVEPLSLDEAYLDVTVNTQNQPSATLLARQICRQIYEQTGLTASAGVSFNKFLAKVASDLRKPNGISVIRPEMAADFLAGLPIGAFHGVGTVTEQKMIRLGITCGADLLDCSRAHLVEHFGKHGEFFYHIVRGCDQRPVQPQRIRKSIGAESTLGQDTSDLQQINQIIVRLAERVGHSLCGRATFCRTLTLKVRYADFVTITRSTTLGQPVNRVEDIVQGVLPLLARTEAGRKKVRLLGVSAAQLCATPDHRPRQLPLPFADPAGQRGNQKCHRHDQQRP